jgi:hypothetical protein
MGLDGFYPYVSYEMRSGKFMIILVQKRNVPVWKSFSASLAPSNEDAVMTPIGNLLCLFVVF